MIKAYKQRLDRLISNKYYLLCVIATAIISYGFAITHGTIDIDTLEGDRYIGSGNIMLSAGRFGMNFWARIFGNGVSDPYHAYTVDLIATLLLIAAAIQFCVLFQRASNNRFSTVGCIIFSCVFISYPLINEIWEYTGANVCVCGGYFLTGISVYCIYELLNNKNLSLKQKILCILISLFCATIICSAYESIAAVYVLVVFIVLFLKSVATDKKEYTFSKLLKEGIIYSIFLACGCILRLITHKIILFVFKLEKGGNGATEIYWGEKPFIKILKGLIKSYRHEFIQKAQIYFPIAVVSICIAILFFIMTIGTIKRKDFKLFFCGAGMMLSLILLSLVQGELSPERTNQPFALFCAAVILFTYNIIKNKKTLGRIFAIAMAILCINQATYLSNISQVNYARSEYEADIVKTIGTDLMRKGYKKVIVVGEITIPDNIMDQVYWSKEELSGLNKIRSALGRAKITPRKKVNTNVQSVLNWSIRAFGDGKSLDELFAFYGFDIENHIEEELVSKARDYAIEISMPAYPRDGYISELGEYAVVCLDEVSNNN